MNNNNNNSDWMESNFDENLSSLEQQELNKPVNTIIKSSNSSLPPTEEGDEFTNSFQFQFAKSMFQSTTSKVVPSWFSFGFLKPYFINLDEKQVLNRIIQSVKPLCPMINHVDEPDLFIPLVATFTLAIILDFQMKFSDVHVNEGTLIGTSLFASFVYWISASVFFFVAGLVLGCNLTLISILCITGYQLVPICLVQVAVFVLFGATGSLPTIIPYLLYFTIGLSGSINFGLTFYSRTAESTPQHNLLSSGGSNQVVKKTNGFILLGIVVLVHMIYMLWVSTVFRAISKVIS